MLEITYKNLYFLHIPISSGLKRMKMSFKDFTWYQNMQSWNVTLVSQSSSFSDLKCPNPKLFQLAELECRVGDAESRAESAELQVRFLKSDFHLKFKQDFRIFILKFS